MNALRYTFTRNSICRLFYLVRKFSLIGSNMTEQKLILYGDEASPPVRFVMMTAHYLKIDLDFRKVDLFRAENKTEIYTKINPLQKVPALAVQDTIICDSHAIALYLCQQRVGQDLYPTEDALLKARVDEMLYFNSGSLFPTDSAIFSDYFASKPLDEKQVQRWNSLLDYLDDRLRKSVWLAGDKISLSDLCCAATVSSLQLLIPASDSHEKINQWMDRLQELHCFKINANGLKRLKMFVEMMKSET